MASKVRSRQAGSGDAILTGLTLSYHSRDKSDILQVLHSNGIEMVDLEAAQFPDDPLEDFKR